MIIATHIARVSVCRQPVVRARGVGTETVLRIVRDDGLRPRQYACYLERAGWPTWVREYADAWLRGLMLSEGAVAMLFEKVREEAAP